MISCVSAISNYSALLEEFSYLEFEGGFHCDLSKGIEWFLPWDAVVISQKSKV